MKHSSATGFDAVALMACTCSIVMTALLGCANDADRDPNYSDTPALSSAPTGVRWEEFQGVSLPVARQGPHRIAGAAATGYDRSPTGAALASIHSTVRMSVALDSQWALVGRRMLMPGLGRDRWASARAQISITQPVDPADAPKILGYNVSQFTADATNVEIVSVYPDNSLTQNSAHVLWEDDDWRLRLPEEPSVSPVVALDVVPPAMVPLR